MAFDPESGPLMLRRKVGDPPGRSPPHPQGTMVGDSGKKSTALEGRAARELLLAEASDWPFLISSGCSVSYAVRRVREHLSRVDALLNALEDERSDAPSPTIPLGELPFLEDLPSEFLR